MSGSRSALVSPPSPGDIVLAAPVRTPIGKFGGALAALSAADLGTAAAAAALSRAGLAPGRTDLVDQVIFGHARQAGGGPNTARQIAHRAGVPDDRPAFTVNQACGSGLQAVLCAARAILLGEARVVLAGGTESMSNTPYLLPRARWGYRLGHGEIVDGMYRDGFDDPLSGLVMGATAEELAVEAGIDRAAADAYALRSQERCERARAAGRFAAEIVPVEVAGKRGASSPGAIVVVDRDEHPRDGVTLEALARMAPVFRQGGTVTAANASGITDGAAALIVASRQAAAELGLPVTARLLGWEVVGVEPRIMGIGPVPAVRRLLERCHRERGGGANGGLPAFGATDATGALATTDEFRALDAIDTIELNEAFASQVLACLAGLDLPADSERVNPDGGAIALGHPIGATGARILVTLLHGLEARQQRLGIATLCVSGGMGLAALVERESPGRREGASSDAGALFGEPSP
ncbi:MAG TPA: thiolase family protein [Thermoanaerobaculia bacterium]|nr:thiolase family protein [Thermoanaerobaculia bacterium]